MLFKIEIQFNERDILKLEGLCHTVRCNSDRFLVSALKDTDYLFLTLNGSDKVYPYLIALADLKMLRLQEFPFKAC